MLATDYNILVYNKQKNDIYEVHAVQDFLKNQSKYLFLFLV